MIYFRDFPVYLHKLVLLYLMQRYDTDSSRRFHILCSQVQQYCTKPYFNFILSPSHSPLILLDLYINYMYQLLPPQCHLRLCVRFLWLPWQITTYWFKTQLDFNRTDFFFLSSGGQKSKIKVWAVSFPAEFLKGNPSLASCSLWWLPAFLALRQHCCSPCHISHIASAAFLKLSLALFCKETYDGIQNTC